MRVYVIILCLPYFRCKIPGLFNDTWDVKSIEHRDLVNYYIPPSDTYPYDRCHLYIRDNSTVEKSENFPMVKCKEWVFDPSVFTNTLVKQVHMSYLARRQLLSPNNLGKRSRLRSGPTSCPSSVGSKLKV